jgi:hypothetical protein
MGDAGEVDDGQVLYIDPNDPQAAEILQQAGLRLAEDGTVTSIADSGMVVNSEPILHRSPPTMDMPSIESITNSAASLIGQGTLGMGFVPTVVVRVWFEVPSGWPWKQVVALSEAAAAQKI